MGPGESIGCCNPASIDSARPLRGRGKRGGVAARASRRVLAALKAVQPGRFGCRVVATMRAGAKRRAVAPPYGNTGGKSGGEGARPNYKRQKGNRRVIGERGLTN